MAEAADQVAEATESAAGLAARVQAALLDRGESLAVAESLTGGLIGATLTGVAGASATFRGGVVAYATDLKAGLLGVDPDLLARVGAVHPDVAAQMAAGVRDRLQASYGLAATGVAGPDPQDGRAPGEVHLAAVGPAGVLPLTLQLTGDRAAIRTATVPAALTLLLEMITRA